MGFKDKMLARAMAKMPDYKGIITDKLGDEGPCLAWALVMPSAYTRGGSGGGLQSRLVNGVINGGINAVSKSRHIGGAEGSIAKTLPLDDEYGLMLSVSSGGFTFWDFGIANKSTDPSLRVRIPREQIVSFLDTGKKAQGGVAVARLTFADESFIDYRVMIPSGPEFWVEVDLLVS